jgi:hypothetical protein
VACNDPVQIRLDKGSSSSALLPELVRKAYHLKRWLLKDQGRFIDGKARHFWVEQDDQDPANETDCGIESECARWRKRVHLGEESRRYNDYYFVRCDDFLFELVYEPFEAQQEQVNHIVPILRTSWLKKSVLIHAVLPTETP